MGKNTSISLGEHFERFLDEQVASGRYGNRSEVVRAALRDMERREQQIEDLRAALREGIESGPHRRYDFEKILTSARRRAGLDA